MEQILPTILRNIVKQHEQHARWLNTLSYMENAGAKKISASEHPQDVTLLILKHAAEEHRHAYYLKKQLAKIDPQACPTYHNQYLLAPNASKYYLNTLDVHVCRHLRKELGLTGSDLKFAAYLLVTYAIEVRADALYPVYQDVLDEAGSRVNVKSIILEEEGHLEEMLIQLKEFSPDWEKHANVAIQIEEKLFQEWMKGLQAETFV
ncbi:MAG: hypothetical protein EOP48_13580 [Sphingobacteriales bacterium]|nr:MAG: hypothetical protein EOP48_13580 [Sphingobacteriales bacterium]